MIRLMKYDDLTLFKKDVISFLEQFEVENNLVLGILHSLSENDEIPLFMATVIKDNDIGLVLLQTHPNQIILSKSVSLTSKEIHVIGEKLINTIQDIPGLIGEKKLTIELAMYIANVKGIQSSVLMDQKIYKLEKVKKKTTTNGKLRRIIENDHHTIKEWVYQFCNETNQPVSLEEADKRAARMINKGSLVAWEVKGELVSMASSTRPTQNNITISYVYTPISERKKGYASDCVSAFTQFLLDRGYKTTSLYTDLSNPTSNKIYFQIGYETIMDSIVIHFK
ncbi:putative GNAT family acetyltransferase [Paenibacillus sp. V4I3]|uniref:GNAT family N-acetyltransferase n=1 Tax=unclassified Paenibacillus TaxID=185978 RepID=UPI00278BAB81|nr:MULTISPECIES: GNAT family N-acetyltransferase [unclassified Paenibacillus]MDQ0875722.1 putative GNAT family acetyltransferase [Paenibacillus sp. V4I3]MDQ0888208.1 putative GNAT family acetyltransferase [Paenibacillus sp. V4I9]